jgi:peptidyl-prolyl cis-trans isomerase A (cyclophilin A)
MRTFLLAWTSVCLLAPSVAFGQASPAPKPAAPEKAAASSTRSTHMTDPALLHPATLTAKAPETYDVKFETTKGDVIVKVTRAWAPNGADRFYNLVKHGFYDGAPFFRVVPGFVVQFGLNGDPAVNKVWQNANIKDDAVKQSNKPGMLVFATAGPNTRTTQLFINLGNNAGLDGQGFAPFGEVTTGMDIVQKIYSGYGERPDQSAITSQGRAYVEKNFPNIDSIKKATVVTAAQ